MTDSTDNARGPELKPCPPEDQAIQDAERGTVEFIESEIRALAKEAET